MACGDELLRPEIQQLLAAPAPDLHELRGRVVAAYGRESGREVDPDELSDEQRQAVASWLRAALISESRFVGLMGAPNVLRAAMFDGLESKVSWLHQAPCMVCGLRADFPVSLFWLRVSPVSQQAQTTAFKRAFRRAVAAALEDRQIEHYGSTDLCVRIVYFLSASRRAKLDLDNLTKGTLDALRGRVFDDDAQVVHLDLVKVRGTGDDESIAVRIRPTGLNDHVSDTFRQTFEASWAGAEMRELSDYLD